MPDWKNFYKYDAYGAAVANMLYEPLVNEERTVFCMNWNANKYYSNELMTEELYQFWFEREVKYLLMLKYRTYAPEVLDIDYGKRKIKFRWYDKSLNYLIEKNTIESISNWKDKVKAIITDLEKQGIYKINTYPHTFYFDDKNQAHCMDMYGCSDNNSRYIDIDYLRPLIRNDRFSKFTINNTVDTHELYQETISTNYAQWPGDFLNV
jgi:hypothetical protein